jgi:hypothetical protein
MITLRRGGFILFSFFLFKLKIQTQQ